MSEKLDHLKYFITILWEMKTLDNTKYALLAEKLSTVGRMVGGLMSKL